jgi:hypothetical protein
LQHLDLQNSTVDGKTTKVSESLVKTVCDHLRGLRTLDGQKSPIEPFNSTQIDALNFLYLVCGLGINGVKHVDISNQGLSSEIFFFVLAALSELHCVRTMHASGNGWNAGKGRLFNYRQYVIYALGEQLHSLDGEVIIDGERLMAIRTVRKQEEDDLKEKQKPAQVQKWLAVKDKVICCSFSIACLDPSLAFNESLPLQAHRKAKSHPSKALASKHAAAGQVSLQKPVAKAAYFGPSHFALSDWSGQRHGGCHGPELC